MREIKFRAWTEEKMISPENMNGIGGEFYRGALEKHSDPIEDYVLMQYTGLKDRNGKEIYENDIIQFINSDAKYRIVWDDEDACWNAEYIGGNSTRQALRNSSAKYKEVVGNIYETN
jgi:uncharacterized phage protein (TIGR01671 family)